MTGPAWDLVALLGPAETSVQSDRWGGGLRGEVPVCVQRERRSTAAHCTCQQRQEPQGALALLAPTSEALSALHSPVVLQEWLGGHWWGGIDVKADGAGLGSGLLPQP